MLNSATPLNKEQALSLFFKQIKKRLVDLENGSALPAKLASLITPTDMAKIYNHLISCERSIRVLALDSMDSQMRFDKRFTKLPRTLNLTRDVNGEYVLILETKSKLASGLKDPQTPKFGGTRKNGKPAWRIDTAPQEWVDLVVWDKDLNELTKEEEEAELSQQLCMEATDPKEPVVPLNYSLLGAPYMKWKDIDRSGEKVVVWQQALYSPRAIGTLDKLLEDPKIKLTQTDKERIGYYLIKAIKNMHDKNKVHQDIKGQNILVFKDEKGQYYVKLTDFGLSKESTALATLGYESPEISVAHDTKNPNDYYYKYFHCSNPNEAIYPSYGRDCGSCLFWFGNPPSDSNAMNFRQPHPSNDMWAAGILLFELITGQKLQSINNSHEYIIHNNPLLKGLLQRDRSLRFTADQALQLIPKPADAFVPFSTVTPPVPPVVKAPAAPNVRPKRQGLNTSCGIEVSITMPEDTPRFPSIVSW